MGVTDGIRVLLSSPNPQCQLTSSVPLRALSVSSQSESHAMDAVLAFIWLSQIRHKGHH